MLARIIDNATINVYFKQAAAFGDAVFRLIEVERQEKALHRLLVV